MMTTVTSRVNRAYVRSGFEHKILPQEESDEPDNKRLDAERVESCKVFKMTINVESGEPFEDSNQKVGNQLVKRCLA